MGEREEMPTLWFDQEGRNETHFIHSQKTLCCRRRLTGTILYGGAQITHQSALYARVKTFDFPHARSYLTLLLVSLSHSHS